VDINKTPTRSGVTKASSPCLFLLRSKSLICLGKRWQMRGGEGNARWPVSRVLSPPDAGDGHSSRTPVTGRLARPTRTAAWKSASPARAGVPSLLGLAPGGVYRAALVTEDAVRSYRTLSPLPWTSRGAVHGGLLSVALSLGSPPPDVIRHRISLEPGLSSPPCGRAAIRPSGGGTI
jgi:hypothetical protein